MDGYYHHSAMDRHTYKAIYSVDAYKFYNLFLKAAELITFPHFRAVVKQIRLSNNGKLVGVKVI